jgi:hypothetical protein
MALGKASQCDLLSRADLAHEVLVFPEPPSMIHGVILLVADGRHISLQRNHCVLIRPRDIARSCSGWDVRARDCD